MKKICLILAAVLTFTLTTANAADFDDFDDGVAFARAGDYATAFVIFNRLAEQGDADGQFNLALMYLGGDGVTQSHVMATYWTKLAAEQGHAKAQHNLGSMYYDGIGVIQNFELALMWANIASESGYENAKDLRDAVVEQMTQADIATAQRMAIECMASSYENCGY